VISRERLQRGVRAAFLTAANPLLIRASMVLSRSFRSVFYIRHNARRQEHLASLGLDLHGKSVLEIGAGAGDHTTFFLDRGCTVVSVEARAQNCAWFAATLREHARWGYEAAGRATIHQGVAARLGDVVPGRFEIVYCYGLLYHVADPDAALAAMAERCDGMLLLETCVSFGADEAVNPVPERRQSLTQSVEGMGCRPTRPWIFRRLARLFPYVYVPRTQPAHEDFPLDWTRPELARGHMTRAVFIASRRPLVNPALLDHLPPLQTPN
jgi:SAM-dependent methyltransferase